MNISALALAPLSQIDISIDGEWLDNIPALKGVVGALLAAAIVGSVAVMAFHVLGWVLAMRSSSSSGAAYFTSGVLLTLAGAVVLGSLSGMVAWGMGEFAVLKFW